MALPAPSKMKSAKNYVAPNPTSPTSPTPPTSTKKIHKIQITSIINLPKS